jgi:hypothetical protein
LLVEQRGDHRLLRLPEFGALLVSRGEEGHAVGAVKRVLVLVIDQQDFADLRLTALHGAFDLRRLEQRGTRVDLDLEAAARRRLHGLGEFADVLRVEIRGRISGRQIPLGLRHGTAGGQRDDGTGAHDDLEHGSPLRMRRAERTA